MKKHKKRESKGFILEHIKNNIHEYAILILLFVTGIVVGVYFLNNVSKDMQGEIVSYINEFLNSIQTNSEIDYLSVLTNAIIKNLFFAGILWLLGIAVTLTPVIYLTISFRGFSLGYAISAMILALDKGNGLILSAGTLLLQNIITIPALLAIAVSGIQVNKRILKNTKDKNFHSKSLYTKDNIKSEIIRHSIFSLIMACILVFSAFIETYFSLNLCRFAAQII